LSVDAQQFLEHHQALQTEAFGPVCLVVLANEDQMPKIVNQLEGNLTGSIYSGNDDADSQLYTQLEPILRQKVGRLLNDKMPTGVAVSPAMNHGGPFPATLHSGFTAVGFPASVVRFAALHCYDNVRPERLPPELDDTNSLGIWRFVDGVYSTAKL
jgi:2,5-dioxopentanoate dehydrogenase